MRTNIEVIKCDCCKKEIKYTASNCLGDELIRAVVNIEIETWYQGKRIIKDICRDCSIKIITFLEKEIFLD